MKKERADVLLVARGLAETRHKAQALIMAGQVRTGGGERVAKSGQLLAPEAILSVETPFPFVSRGGLKLADALDAFGIDVRGLVAADIGSSTGGFTDCFLKRGAARVYAVDVDIRQLDDRLRRDPRVVTVEKNARYLAPGDLPERPAITAVDVSFISVAKILPALRDVLGPPEEIAGSAGAGAEAASSETTPPPEIPIHRLPPVPDEGEFAGGEEPSPPPPPAASSAASSLEAGPMGPSPVVLVLIKPQFEAGRDEVGKKGIVRDPEIQAAVLTRIVREAGSLGFRLRGLHRSSTRGQKGNQEFFARFALDGLHPAPEDVIKWIFEVTGKMRSNGA
jgi:TlyA family rRNA methyltransferase/putative hemolysin